METLRCICGNMGKNLNHLVCFLLICSAVFAVFAEFSCSSHGSDSRTGPPEYTVTIHRFLPFVDSVELPETAVAGESFTITLTLSAVSNPNILMSYNTNKPEAQVMETPTFLNPETYLIWTNLLAYTDEIEADDRETVVIVLNVEPLHAGDYVFQFSAADIRENGGLNISYNMGSGRFLFSENESHIKTFYFPITVLPPDEGEGE